MPAPHVKRPLTAAERAVAAQNIKGARLLANLACKSKPNLDRDDVLSACFVALCHAAQRWKPDKGAFMTCLKWQVMAQVKQLEADLRPAGFKDTGRQPAGSFPATSVRSPEVVILEADRRWWYSVQCE